MTGHDPLCPLRDERTHVSICPYCPVIARARADEHAKTVMEEIGDEIRADRERERERERCSQLLADVDSRVRGVANDAHEATVEFVVAAEREKIARAIESLRYPEAVFAYEVKKDAARIAREGSDGA